MKIAISGGGNSKFLAVRWDPTPSSWFRTKVWGKGGQSTSGRSNKEISKEGEFLVRSGIQEYIILGDNSAGQCLVFWDLVPRSFLNKF